MSEISDLLIATENLGWSFATSRWNLGGIQDRVEFWRIRAIKVAEYFILHADDSYWNQRYISWIGERLEDLRKPLPVQPQIAKNGTISSYSIRLSITALLGSENGIYCFFLTPQTAISNPAREMTDGEKVYEFVSRVYNLVEQYRKLTETLTKQK